MKAIVREITWLGGLLEHGWGNGYVVIPQGHPLHGKDYEEINVDVHGGLTYADVVDEEIISTWEGLTDEDEGSWMVGFDTCHCYDNSMVWTKEAVESETQRLLEQLENYTVEA